MENRLQLEIMDKFTRSVNKIIYASGKDKNFTVVFDGSFGSRVLYNAFFKTGRFGGCKARFVHFKSWFEIEGLSDLLKAHYPEIEIAEPPSSLYDAILANGLPSVENRWCCYAKGGYGWYKKNPEHGIIIHGMVLKNAQDRETKSEYSSVYPSVTVMYPFMREWNEDELRRYLVAVYDPLIDYIVKYECCVCPMKCGRYVAGLPISVIIDANTAYYETKFASKNNYCVSEISDRMLRRYLEGKNDGEGASSCAFSCSGFAAADRDMSENFMGRQKNDR